MLDNLEEVDDPELMVFLRDLPAPSKAIVTTRHRIDVAVPIHLHSLDEATAQELVRIECDRHNLALSDAQIALLLQRTGGLPLAIIRTLSRIAWRGSNVETEIRHLQDPNNGIYDFCFAKTVALIESSDAYWLFVSLALFANEVTREAVGYVGGFAESILRRDEGLSDLEVLSLCYRNNEYFGLEQLTRTQALAELRAHPDFEAEARARWVAWYLRFTERYGGRDEQEMHLRYDHLEDDWDNILSVFQWCMDEGRYADVVALWQNVRDFTHIYGYWTDRLHLLDWLIDEADSRGDAERETLARMLYDKAFTLTLTSPSTCLDDADALLQRCASLSKQTASALQARIAALQASLNIKLMRYGAAHARLDAAETLLQDADIPAAELARERTSLLFDRGEAWLVMGDYAKAQETFEEMLEQATLSGWQRSAVHAESWLAYTAVLQGDCALSEKYLHLGWSVANRIKEKRLIAYYKRTFAYYYQKIGNPTEALTWSEDARDTFERLGMPPDIHEMEALIAALTGA
jgi:LuxR family glucitol operon transcriptional activator